MQAEFWVTVRVPAVAAAGGVLDSALVTAGPAAACDVRAVSREEAAAAVVVVLAAPCLDRCRFHRHEHGQGVLGRAEQRGRELGGSVHMGQPALAELIHAYQERAGAVAGPAGDRLDAAVCVPTHLLGGGREEGQQR